MLVLPCRKVFQIKIIISSNNCLSGTAFLSQFFQVVMEEVKVLPEYVGFDCLQLKVICMSKWTIWALYSDLLQQEGRKVKKEGKT